MANNKLAKFNLQYTYKHMSPPQLAFTGSLSNLIMSFLHFKYHCNAHQANGIWPLLPNTRKNYYSNYHWASYYECYYFACGSNVPLNVPIESRIPWASVREKVAFVNSKETKKKDTCVSLASYVASILACNCNWCWPSNTCNATKPWEPVFSLAHIRTKNAHWIGPELRNYLRFANAQNESVTCILMLYLA